MIMPDAKACGQDLKKRNYSMDATTHCNDSRTVKTLIWRYFISYWNNRRICSADGGLPPMIKRQKYYDSLQKAA